MASRHMCCAIGWRHLLGLPLSAALILPFVCLLVEWLVRWFAGQSLSNIWLLAYLILSYLAYLVGEILSE